MADSLSIPCPRCGAAAYEQCVDRRSKEPSRLGRPHKERRALANQVPVVDAEAVVLAGAIPGRCSHRTPLQVAAGLNPVCPRCRMVAAASVP